MKRLTELFAERREVMAREVRACRSPGETVECVSLWLDALRQAYVPQLEIEKRVRANALFLAARSGAEMLDGMTRADVHLKLPDIHPPLPSSRLRVRELLTLLPAALCAVLDVWLLADGRPWATLLAMCAGVASYLSLRALKAPAAALPEAEATPLPDENQILRRMEHLMSEMDALMEAENAPDAPERPMLTQPVLEAVQMLCEASLDADAEFALRAVPQLADALEQQGVQLLTYCPEQRARFDLLPAERGGHTIRPALVCGDRTLSRGLATAEKN